MMAECLSRQCGTCCGTGVRGLFGPRGFGLIKKSCHSCQGVGMIQTNVTELIDRCSEADTPIYPFPSCRDAHMELSEEVVLEAFRHNDDILLYTLLHRDRKLVLDVMRCNPSAHKYLRGDFRFDSELNGVILQSSILGE